MLNMLDHKKAEPDQQAAVLSAQLNWQKNKIQKGRAHQEEAFKRVNELVFKKREGKIITLVDGAKLTEFVSCSYLGLDLDERVIEASSKNIRDCGVTFPAARTRIKAQSFIELDNLLDQIFLGKTTVLFQSLHLAHLGLIPILASGEMPSYPLAKKGALFVLDKKVHASIQINRGLMNQLAEVASVDFNDFNALEAKFIQAKSKNITPIAIADSVASMCGFAPINLLLEMAEKYNGYIYFDDAHGMSIFGKHGCGYVLHQLNNKYHPRMILTSSLSKAFGTIGGLIVLPSQKDANIIKRFSSTYIFSGPPALAIIDAAIASANIHLSDEIYMLQDKLQDNIQYFDEQIQVKNILNFKTCSPMRGIFVGDEFKSIDAAYELRKRGLAVTAAMYPVVAKGKSILRITLGATHTQEQIRMLCYHLNEIMH